MVWRGQNGINTLLFYSQYISTVSNSFNSGNLYSIAVFSVKGSSTVLVLNFVWNSFYWNNSSCWCFTATDKLTVWRVRVKSISNGHKIVGSVVYQLSYSISKCILRDLE